MKLYKVNASIFIEPTKLLNKTKKICTEIIKTG